MNEPDYDPLLRYGGLAEAKRLFDKNVTLIKDLVEKIGNLLRLTLDQRNYFLYDISNIINCTFYTELNRKVQTYCMTVAAPGGIKSTHMVTLKKRLKFNVQKEEYRESVIVQLERITSQKPYKCKEWQSNKFIYTSH